MSRKESGKFPSNDGSSIARPLSPNSLLAFDKRLREKDPFSKLIKIGKKIHKYSEEEIFIFTHAKFFYDFEKGQIMIDEIDFDKNHSREFESRFPKSDAGYSAGTLLSVMKNLVAEMLEDKEAFRNPSIYNAKKPLGRKIEGGRYLSYSSYRTNARETVEHDIVFLAARLLISSYVQNITRILNRKSGSEEFSYEELRARISKTHPVNDSISFLRDSSTVIGGEIYHIDSAIKNLKPNMDTAINSNTAIADLSSQDIGIIKSTPFLFQGGNIVVDEEKKKIFMSNSFVEGNDYPYVNSQGKIEIIPASQVYENAKNWAKQRGYEMVVIERTPNKDATLDDLYHLDVFFNVIGPYVIVPEENIISKKARDKLIEIYGVENIIPLSKVEREALCTNFISFDNNVLVTSPHTPPSFIAKLNDKGLNVILPPFHMSVGPNSGIRCCTQIKPNSWQDKIKQEASQFQVRHYDKQEIPEYKPSYKPSKSKADPAKNSDQELTPGSS